MTHIGIDASRIAVAERTGTERYSYELIAALARIDRRRRYTLYTNGLPAALPPLGPNFTLRSLPLRRLWTHARLGPELARRPPDLLFVPSHVIPLLHPAASVVTIHDLGYLAFPAAHTARRRLELHLTTRWSLRAARRVIAISQATRDDLVRHYGADPAKIRVVHHGLSAGFRPAEPAQISAVRARYGIDRPYFLYVGTIQPRKNLARLIEGFAASIAGGLSDKPFSSSRRGASPLSRTRERGTGGEGHGSHPNTVNPPAWASEQVRSNGITRPLLLIAGRRGWLSAPIERRAAELGVAERVRFIGYVPDADLPALLSGALAFVFPSLYEGFGMPVLEALACGAPVLTSRSSALPEVAGDAALLVDPLDTAAIAAGLTRLASDADLRADLRTKGLARAATFTWERCAEETLEVLLEHR